MFFVVACNKKKDKQLSTWYVNNQATSSNNVMMYEGRGGSSLFVMDGDKINNADTNNGFYLRCGTGALPFSGTSPLYNGPPSNDPSLLRLSIFHNGIQYQLSKHNTASILTTGIKGERKFELPETWFTNTRNEQDSALVKGVFAEP